MKLFGSAEVAFRSGTYLPAMSLGDPEPPTRQSRLWTEPRETGEQKPWLRPAAPWPADRSPLPGPGDTGTAGPDEGHPRPARPRRRVRHLVLAATAAALVAAGALGTSLLDGDEEAPTPAALPASAGSTPVDSRSRTVRSVYAAASPSVVSVRVARGGSAASGTGWVVDGQGTIVTNAHVVGEATEARVQLDDRGRDVDADVLGADPSSDLAVLRIAPNDAAGLRPLPLADSDRVQVGDLAVAIGYPLGLDQTATAGIVSGLGREIEAPNGFSIDEVIQTDAPINPGNSGGPLLDARGRVIGVNSQIATAGSGGSVGIGFAVPANTVREVVPRLSQGQRIARAYLGVSSGASPTGPGALVAEVTTGGPADAAGVRPGDVISRVAGQAIDGPQAIADALEERRPGERVDVELQRAGARRTLEVMLGTRPERRP